MKSRVVSMLSLLGLVAAGPVLVEACGASNAVETNVFRHNCDDAGPEAGTCDGGAEDSGAAGGAGKSCIKDEDCDTGLVCSDMRHQCMPKIGR